MGVAACCKTVPGGGLESACDKAELDGSGERGCCTSGREGLDEGACRRAECDGFGEDVCCKTELGGLAEGLRECGLRNPRNLFRFRS